MKNLNECLLCGLSKVDLDMSKIH